ncbi:60S ACIDIC ribosomal protein P2B [Anaeramoeba flamelloides]|uniref:60S ACIDIC ribosomal protein P2B n=1 Tax=Anaeramoeba flamelloides TaxID=1746091 RepID=A0AAV7ZBV4_9EUKA|nr:60S ACIDIC ribosomal protein P2B [Anaeramoeba flamelloides]
MSVIPLYSLLVLGGNLHPTEEDLFEAYKNLCIDVTNEKERLTKFLELIKDKDIFEVLKRGQFEKKKPPQMKIEKETEDNNKEESNQQTTEQINDPLPDPLLDQINIQEQFQIENAIQQNQNQNENNNTNQTQEIEVLVTNLFSD